MSLRRRAGFTLVELLVVIAIIGLLIALLLPAVQAAREAARRNQCSNNLKQLGIGIQNYHDALQRFPPLATGPYPVSGSNGHGQLSYLVLILPYIEQQPIYDQINWTGDVKGASTTFMQPWNAAYRPWFNEIPTLICPSDILCPTDQSNVFNGQKYLMGHNNYKACVGNTTSDNQWDTTTTGIFACDGTTSMSDVIDGTSHTLLVGERCQGNAANRHEIISGIAMFPNANGMNAMVGGYNTGYLNCLATVGTNGTNYNKLQPVELNGSWYAGERWCDGAAYYSAFTAIIPPNGPSCLTNMTNDRHWGIFTLSSRHSVGAQVVMADGHVQLLTDSIDVRVVQSLGTKAGNEAIDNPAVVE